MSPRPLVAVLLLALGCRGGAPADPRGAQEVSRVLSALAELYWEERLRHDPALATWIAVRRHQELLPDLSEAERPRHLAALAAIRGELSRIDPARLGPSEAITAKVLAYELSRLERLDGC